MCAGCGDDVDAEQDSDRLRHLGQPRARHGPRGRDEKGEGVRGGLDKLEHDQSPELRELNMSGK